MAGFETLGAETDKRQSERLEALHHGGLWGCPLVYSTTIAPYQRATSRASMSRALWHNAEMQDGVKHFLAAHSQLSLGTFHHGGLWGCPLLYSTTIAPSQRATSRASMSRALWHNAEMQDGVKHFLAAHSQLSLGTFHHGGLWGCPLLYSTTIAPSQRATSRASP